MNIRFIFILFFLPFLELEAQTVNEHLSSKNQVGIQIGFAKNFLSDEVFSPLNYSGNGINFGLSYKILKPKHLLLSEINYSISTISNSISTYTESRNDVADLRISYLRKVGSASKSFKMYFGGGLSNHFNNLIFEDADATTYFNLHAVELSYYAAYHINSKHQLNLLLHVPIFGVLVRPPYTGWDSDSFEKTGLALAYNGKWTSTKDFSGLVLAASYEYSLSSKVNVLLKSSFQYYKTDYLGAAKNFSIQNSIGINVNL